VTLTRNVRAIFPALVIGSTLLAATPRGLASQIPGESVHQRRVSLRGEFLAVTYDEIQRTLAEWLKALDRRNLDRVENMLNDDVVFAPVEGWTARGRKQVGDSLRSLTERMSAYNFAISDYDASSNLAYLLGSVHYQLERGASRQVVSGEASMVLVRRGDEWKIRSYVERGSR
jgi:ketosteroid isomerase-like protein